MKRRVMLLLATMAVALVVASGVTLAQSQVRSEHYAPGLHTASEAARAGRPCRAIRRYHQPSLRRGG
jgi:hypothetical protein